MKFVPQAYFSILSETDFNQFLKKLCVKQIGTKKFEESELFLKSTEEKKYVISQVNLI